MDKKALILTGTNCSYKSTLAGLIEPCIRESVVYPSSTVLVRNGLREYQADSSFFDGTPEEVCDRFFPRIDLTYRPRLALDELMKFGRVIYKKFSPQQVADIHWGLAKGLYPYVPVVIFEGIRYFETVNRLKETTSGRVVALRVPDDVIVRRLVIGKVYTDEASAADWVQRANEEYGFRQIEEELADEVHSTVGLSREENRDLAAKIAQNFIQSQRPHL